MAGVSTDDGAVYLAHLAGPGAAIRILKARENAPIKMLMGAKAVKANPFLNGKTARWVRDWAARKMAG